MKMRLKAILKGSLGGLPWLKTWMVFGLSVFLFLVSPLQSGAALEGGYELSALGLAILQQGAAKAPAAVPQKAPPANQETQAVSPPRDPGLYMTFHTTLGSISCKLYENEAP